MADCECLATCPFFNDQMADMPSTAEMFKKNYCKSDNSNCARFIVFKARGKDNVPGDLFPNQVGRANRLIGQG